MMLILQDFKVRTCVTVTVSLINMPAMLNKINFMHLCYSLMPVLQQISIKVAFVLLSDHGCRLDSVGPKLKVADV